MTDRHEIAAFRFGFGLPVAADLPAASALAGPDEAALRWPSVTSADMIPVMQGLREARGMAAEAVGDAADTKAAKKAQRRAIKSGNGLATKGAKAAVARAVGGSGPRERLVRFWTDHFTVVSKARTDRAWPAALVEDAIRPHLGHRFADMLSAVTFHPAMLIYLDQINSLGPNSTRGKKRGRGLNENLARELLELHTLGAGSGYSQDDVRQMAELLTGLTVVPDRGFAFDAGRVEPGAETVLGVSYDGAGTEPILQALGDLAVRPETARHLAGKLAVHFLSDTPDPALVAALEAAWLQTGGDLAAVAEVLFTHPTAWVPEAAKARQPFDFVVAALRALGVTGDQVMALDDPTFLALILDPMASMGQPWNGAPGPNGWPEAAEDWITPQGMAARITWAMEVPEKLRPALPDARDFALQALGSRASERLLWAVKAAETTREGIGLVLSSPEFNRR